MEGTKKFYQMTIEERREEILKESALSAETLAALSGTAGLSEETADRMIENVIGRYSLPLGIARNFLINGKQYLIPMVIEEPSVVAAASNGARIAAMGGGFKAEADEPRMIGQLQILDVPDIAQTKAALESQKAQLLTLAAESCPRLIGRCGGPVDLEIRVLEETAAGPMLILHLIMDVRDVMGANLIDTALEHIAPAVENISGGTVRLRILSNLADRRLARASCSIPVSALAFKEYDGETVRDRMLEAAAFAEADSYRAVTHNKGIMNGIDAVVLATGNDWRAVEAGAHAWSVREIRNQKSEIRNEKSEIGNQKSEIRNKKSEIRNEKSEIRNMVPGNSSIAPLTHWSKDHTTGNLLGAIELPMAVGTVGGATRVHPGAAAALRLMGVQSAGELAGVIAAVGLAQNLAALKVLSTEGIQRGHMSLHAKQMAVAAGAQGEAADRIAARMVRENRVSVSYAAELAAEMIKESVHA